MSEAAPAGAHDPTAAPRRRGVRRDVVSAVAVVVVFAVVGVGAGWLWHRLWDAPQGQSVTVPENGVVTHQWFPLDETSLGGMFDATGLYILIGLGAALVLGVLVGLLVRRSELVIGAAVLLGSALAAWLCHLVGVHLGPPDPATVAATAPDHTRIPDQMTTPGHSLYVAWPLGAVLGLGATYLLTARRLPQPAPLPPPPGRED